MSLHFSDFVTLEKPSFILAKMKKIHVAKWLSLCVFVSGKGKHRHGGVCLNPIP
ncbi:hypothetical protein GCM10007100_36380 [Roseibacillus persicicus]|uniref:Uncharacterized protein n=1 Tax=Roseibacillus persicicus TaxID=454148 RepID=A0A918TWV9_9BACT|nr:hypothetical protein GCM10007100_36380 [Roseibacillus persicicus]